METPQEEFYNTMKNLHIFYVHYNVEGKGTNPHRPDWFNYEKSFQNLLSTIKGKNIQLNVVMDVTQGKLEDNWIYKYKDQYTSYIIEGGNMDKVTVEVYTIIKNSSIPSTDLVYILENDYLHVPNWPDKVLNLYNTFEGLTYVSLYDHNDKYFLPMYDNLTSKIFTTIDHHWRSTPSTCGSYITTKKIFDEDFYIHTGAEVPIGDHHKWIHLSSTKSRHVVTPIPGLSTHCMSGLLSPTINWKQINSL